MINRGEKMSVGIVGMGVVGKAHKTIFKDAIEYDLDKGSKKEINSLEIVFVCVSTPTKEDGEQDISAVEDVLSWLDVPIIVLKSTVLPGTTKRLIDKYKKDILYSPEFLRQDYADKDIRTSPIVICGNKKKATKVGLLYGRKYIGYDKPEYGELLKYTMNSFFALKVSYFNQISDICNEMDIDYKQLRLGIMQDKRIGDSHTEVTEERGFGGECFPKDTKALTNKYNVMVSIIGEAIKYNDIIRNK